MKSTMDKLEAKFEEWTGRTLDRPAFRDMLWTLAMDDDAAALFEKLRKDTRADFRREMESTHAE